MWHGASQSVEFVGLHQKHCIPLRAWREYLKMIKTCQEKEERGGEGREPVYLAKMPSTNSKALVLVWSKEKASLKRRWNLGWNSFFNKAMVALFSWMSISEKRLLLLLL